MGSIKGNSISSEHNTLPDRAIALKDSGNLNAFLLLGRAHSRLGVDAWCVNPMGLFIYVLYFLQLMVYCGTHSDHPEENNDNLCYTWKSDWQKETQKLMINPCYSVLFLFSVLLLGMSSLGWILYNFIMTVIFEYLKVSNCFLLFKHRSKGILICLKVCAVSKQ